MSLVVVWLFVAAHIGIRNELDKPIIKVLGSNPFYTTVRADDYYDASATCFDVTNSDISPRIQVDGQVVDLQVAGVYKLTYTCKNKHGVTADPKTRTIYVQDKFGIYLFKIENTIQIQRYCFRVGCKCDDTCPYSHDGHCEDAGPGSLGKIFAYCSAGTDCTDCGPSTRETFAPGGKCNAIGADDMLHYRSLLTFSTRSKAF